MEDQITVEIKIKETKTQNQEFKKMELVLQKAQEVKIDL